MFNFATIKSKFEFKNTCQKGLNIKGKYFVLKFIPESTTKIGFIITKKVGNSVVRNRIRRRLRAIISDATKLNLLTEKGNYVLIARPNIFYDKYEVIEQNFKKILLEVKESVNQ